MKRRDLIAKCEEVIQTFNPRIKTLDSHAEAMLGDCDSATADANLVFVKQVFYGVVREKAALKAFLSTFYNDLAASVLRADYTLYLILAYLTFFRLSELGFREFRKLLEALPPDKVAAFVQYTFDVPRLTKSTKWDWMKLFDLEYIEAEMLAPVEEHSPEAQALVQQFVGLASTLAEEKAASDGKVGLAELPKRSATVPVSPRLTRPARRPVPKPHELPQKVVVGKEPTYLERTSLEQVQEERASKLDEARATTRAKYNKAQEFKLHETRSNLEQVRAEVEAKRARELDFDRDKCGNPPRKPPASSTVKLNAAAILREDALYKRKQEREAKMIQAYESELRDSTEFHAWQAQMQAVDVAARREQVEQVRIGAKLSAEVAAQAMAKQRADNHERAANIKSEIEVLRQQREREEDVQLGVNQALVKEMAEVRDHAPREAELRLWEQKKARRVEILEDKEQRLAAKQERDAQEQAERDERVRQLRALFEVNKKRVNVFDPTESAGIGLLDEMSLLEMKERLVINKVRAQEHEQHRRSEILQAKARRQQDLDNRVSNIERIRAAAAASNREARARQQAQRARQQADDERVREASNLTLKADLDEARRRAAAERRALVEEEERRKSQQAFMGQNAAAAEEAQFDQLLRGAERESVRRQTDAKAASRVYEEVKTKERSVVEATTRKREARKKQLHAVKADELERKRKDLAALEKREIAAKKLAFQTSRARTQAAKNKIMSLNPYAATVGRLEPGTTTTAVR